MMFSGLKKISLLLLLITLLLPRPALGQSAPAPLAISSGTHADQESWSANPKPHFSWSLPEEALGVSTAFDQNPLTRPKIISEGLLQEKSYPYVRDGSWYFHLRYQTAQGWSETSHFKVNIDTLPPSPAQADLLSPAQAFPPVFTLKSEDLGSGLDHFEITLEDGRQIKLLPEELPLRADFGLAPSVYLVKVKIFDKAGNSSLSEFNLAIPGLAPLYNLALRPTILDWDKSIAVSGRAAPKSRVVFKVRPVNASSPYRELIHTLADEEGVFRATSLPYLSPGQYQGYFQAQAPDGRLSPTSKMFELTVTDFIPLGPWRLETKGLRIILIFSIIGIGGLILSFLMLGRTIIKKRKLKKTIIKELKE